MEGKDTDKPPIVVLCGSTRFVQTFDEMSLKFTLKGYIVLSIASHRVSDKKLELTSDQLLMLDRLHRNKIDLADLVFIINKDGYMGEATRSELEYARYNNKKIEFLEELKVE